MNKKLIKTHEEEMKTLTDYIKKTDKELQEKTKKLEKYQDVLKTFNGQIDMFERFQQRSVKDIERLQKESSKYRELYKKEKKENENLVAKLRPSQRPLPENL